MRYFLSVFLVVFTFCATAQNSSNSNLEDLMELEKRYEKLVVKTKLLAKSNGRRVTKYGYSESGTLIYSSTTKIMKTGQIRIKVRCRDVANIDPFTYYKVDGKITYANRKGKNPYTFSELYP